MISDEPFDWITESTVCRVRRIFYVFGESADASRGAIELSFDSGKTVLIDSAADGQSLSFSDSEWADPFEGRMDNENQKYVAKFGKWSAFDLSTWAPYSLLIGCRVEAFRTSAPLVSSKSMFELYSSRALIICLVEMDALRVFHGAG